MDVKRGKIHLASTINGEETQYEYSGEYNVISGNHCVAYTDYTGNALTRVGIEAAPTTMLIHRTGGVTADMLFDPDHETAVNYNVLTLKTLLRLKTHRLIVEAKGSVVRICVEYSLDDGSGEIVTQASQTIIVNIMEDHNEKSV